MSLYLYEKFLEYMGCQWVGTGDQEEAAKAVLDAYIARAEAAERMAEAFEAAYAIGEHSADDGLLDAAYKQYAAAREAVRKLEGWT